jgi:hypothetical protein
MILIGSILRCNIRISPSASDMAMSSCRSGTAHAIENPQDIREQSMAGETDLRKLLLATMTPELRPGIHLFATLPPDAPVPDSLQPVMLFREQQE